MPQLRLGGATIAIAAGLALAACQTTGGAPPQTAGQATVMPSPIPQMKTQRAETSLGSSSSTEVRPDGTRVTRSSRTTASASVDPNVAMASVLGLLLGASAPAGPTREDFAGRWQIRDAAANRTCTLSLSTNAYFNARWGTSNGCFQSDLWGMSGWDLRGREIVLYGQSRTELGTLVVTAPDRLDGRFREGGGELVMWR